MARWLVTYRDPKREDMDVGADSMGIDDRFVVFTMVHRPERLAPFYESFLWINAEVIDNITLLEPDA